MSSSLWPVQTGIYQVLSGDAVLSGIVTGIYDLAVPDSVTPRFPYVVIGEKNELADNRHDRLGRRTTVNIHVFSRYRGSKEASQIADRITALLEGQSVPASGGWHAITCYLEQAIVMEEDVDQSHVVLRFDVRLEKP